MAYSGRNNIYDAVIRRMVTEALAAQDEDFRLRHGNDPDETLLEYLRRCAGGLGHTPWPRELVGGCMIEERFGSWAQALAMAALPGPTHPDRLQSFARYRAERETQQVLYRRKKAEKKAREHMPESKN